MAPTDNFRLLELLEAWIVGVDVGVVVVVTSEVESTVDEELLDVEDVEDVE